MLHDRSPSILQWYRRYQNPYNLRLASTQIKRRCKCFAKELSRKNKHTKTKTPKLDQIRSDSRRSISTRLKRRTLRLTPKPILRRIRNLKRLRQPFTRLRRLPPRTIQPKHLLRPHPIPILSPQPQIRNISPRIGLRVVPAQTREPHYAVLMLRRV